MKPSYMCNKIKSIVLHNLSTTLDKTSIFITKTMIRSILFTRYGLKRRYIARRETLAHLEATTRIGRSIQFDKKVIGLNLFKDLIRSTKRTSKLDQKFKGRTIKKSNINRFGFKLI
ncbi:hypothetical protein HI914_04387 [Erysiphe necator]|nr:hypothetical protein HI914_04387 [Erysiphe necator]